MEERLPGAEAVWKRTFAEFVLPEAKVLPRVARALAARPAGADELVRDTLRRAFRAGDGCGGEQPRTWLLKLMLRASAERRPDRVSACPGGSGSGLGLVPTAATGRQPGPVAAGEAFQEGIEAAGPLGVPEKTLTGVRPHRARTRIRVRPAAGPVPGRGGR